MSDASLDELEGRGERTMASLRSHGVLGLDLDRRPNADDWLLLALDRDALVPVRTDQAVVDERFAVVVHASRPPDDGALRLLGHLASGDRAGLEASEMSGAREAWSWALETADRIIAALRGSRGLGDTSEAPTSLDRSPTLQSHSIA